MSEYDAHSKPTNDNYRDNFDRVFRRDPRAPAQCCKAPEPKFGGVCDYVDLPHSGGGTDHGPAEHHLRGYNICVKCYGAIQAAEAVEEAAYRVNGKR
jgi:hypothetical protein